MIFINRPYIANNGDKTRLICEIIRNKKVSKTVWFEVSKEYGEYLCYERCDAFVIGLLRWALIKGHNIKSDTPITDELYYNITEYLLPSLQKYDKRYKKIKLEMPLAPALKCEKSAVGTGLSCGVDSFHCIVSNRNANIESLKLTHFCINNVGAFNNIYAVYGKDKVRKERYQYAKIAAQDIGLPLIETDSNIDIEFHQNHYISHTYTSVFAVYCLQKLWKTYFYGSAGYDFSHFSLKKSSEFASGHYELLSLQCFSISNLRIYSEGGAKNRFEKTKYIADDELAQKHLHVCTSKPTNCGKCNKCMRTLTTLDAIGKLDNFKQVFDIEYYKNNKNRYYKYLIIEHLKKRDTYNEKTYQVLKCKFPFYLFIIGYVEYKIKDLLKRTKKKNKSI